MKIMKYLTFFVILFVAGVGSVVAEKPTIIATTSDLASIAQAVAGSEARVNSICTGKEDPHFLTAKPSFILMARDADLWIRVGMELEVGWEPPILDGSRNRHILPGQPGHLDASEHIRKLDVPTGKISRAMGDVHSSGNPHYWLDPWNVRVIAGEIAERLSQLYPDRADTYRHNAASFQTELDRRMFGARLVEAFGGDDLWRWMNDGMLDKELEAAGKADSLSGWMEVLRPLKGTKIVCYHTTWTYFANRFGFEIAATLEPVCGVPPTAGHLASVQKLVEREQIPLIVMEPHYNRKAADRVAGERARVVVVANSVGGEPDARDWFSLMDLIVARLTRK